MTYDVEALRARIPALRAGVAHFDGPGGTQTPAPVIAAITDALSNPLSVRGSAAPGEINAETIVRDFRRAMADLLGAEDTGIVVGRSATQLTYDFSRVLDRSWAPGDEVVVSRLDHDANIRPWVQAAERAGAVVRWADFDPATGDLSAASVGALLTDRTRLVAVTAASNLIGTRPDMAAIAELVHRAGALLYVDGVHFAAHAFVDVAELGADFYVCSPYKFFGPHHGVLAASPGCWRLCGRTNWRRPPTPYRSVSSSAPCRTKPSPAHAPPSTSSRTSPPARQATGVHGSGPPTRRSRSTRRFCARAPSTRCPNSTA